MSCASKADAISISYFLVYEVQLFVQCFLVM
jgi:hypothetical protein